MLISCLCGIAKTNHVQRTAFFSSKRASRWSQAVTDPGGRLSIHQTLFEVHIVHTYTSQLFSCPHNVLPHICTSFLATMSTHTTFLPTYLISSHSIFPVFPYSTSHLTQHNFKTHTLPNHQSQHTSPHSMTHSYAIRTKLIHTKTNNDDFNITPRKRWSPRQHGQRNYVSCRRTSGVANRS
jgi:hypothetical protein